MVRCYYFRMVSAMLKMREHGRQLTLTYTAVHTHLWRISTLSTCILAFRDSSRKFPDLQKFSYRSVTQNRK